MAKPSNLKDFIILVDTQLMAASVSIDKGLVTFQQIGGAEMGTKVRFADIVGYTKTAKADAIAQVVSEIWTNISTDAKTVHKVKVKGNVEGTQNKTYIYIVKTGDTVDIIGQQFADDINADSGAIVSAVYTSGTDILELTEKDPKKTKGFTYEVPAATITPTFVANAQESGTPAVVKEFDPNFSGTENFTTYDIVVRDPDANGNDRTITVFADEAAGAFTAFSDEMDGADQSVFGGRPTAAATYDATEQSQLNKLAETVAVV